MTDLPYGFVTIPVDTAGVPESYTDEPVFHDGSQPGLLSGELRCTLRALTPLLAANDQYEAKEVKGATLNMEDETDGNGNKTGKKILKDVTLPGSWGVTCNVAPNKHILEPLRLDDGRVAIAGTALKGMLRQSLGALLAAPMERVGERSYSYRPNLEFPGNVSLLREPRAAIVESWDDVRKELRLKALPRAALGEVVFVDKDAPLPDVTSGTSPGKVPNVKIVPHPKTHVKHLFRDASTADLSNYFQYRYAGGIDGQGLLAKAFGSGRKVYKRVLIRQVDFTKGTSVLVDSNVLAAFDATIEHLANKETGHLRADHPLSKKMADDLEDIRRGIRRSRSVVTSPGQLIFVEVEKDGAGNLAVKSFGQNYRYRWRFANTVHKKNGDIRPILKPLGCEEPVGGMKKNRPPEKLSGARLLFGYVAEDPKGKVKSPGAAGIGTGDFLSMAGRLAFNIAVEHSDNKPDKDWFEKNDRFLKGAEAIPLKILGQPKPSAAEEYLRQPRTPNGKIETAEVRKIRSDHGEYISYGDIAGQKGGELAGRKFYYHQPNAATDQGCYRLNETTQEEAEHIAGDQAALARFVSKPGTQFRFTLRFQDLRPWELGAVLVALDPARLNGAATDKNENNPHYALKLGHARPLGFGSVAIAVDDITLVNQRGEQRDGKAEKDSWLADFRAKGTPLAANVQEARNQWRELHTYRGRASRTYPLARPAQYVRIKDGEVVAPERDHGDETIFNHYTTNRRKHSLGRRLPPPGDSA